MKVQLAGVESSKDDLHLKNAASIKSRLNLLILLHVILFATYAVCGWNGTLEQVWTETESTVAEFINSSLAVSPDLQDGVLWWHTMLTYQFVHVNIGELLLSVSMLWLFGHVLQNRVGQRRVIALYFISSALAALMFYLAHIIFPIFSGSNQVMYGAFAGVLAVMSTTVFLYGNHKLCISGKLWVELWKVYVSALLLSFMLVYQNNIAYVLVYVLCIYGGGRVAQILRHKTIAPVSYQK